MSVYKKGMAIALAACIVASPLAGMTRSMAAGLKDGNYTGEGTGFRSIKGINPLKVEMIVKDGKIAELKFDSKELESEAQFNKSKEALEKLKGTDGSGVIDAVSSVTWTMNGMKEAYNEALTKAGGTVVEENKPKEKSLKNIEVPIILEDEKGKKSDLSEYLESDKAVISVRDGKRTTLRLNLKQVEKEDTHTHLWDGSVYEGSFSGKKTALSPAKGAKVTEEGFDHKDQEFPTAFNIPLADLKQDKVYLTLSVDLEDAKASGVEKYEGIIKGKGAEKAVLKIDYSKQKELALPALREVPELTKLVEEAKKIDKSTLTESSAKELDALINSTESLLKTEFVDHHKFVAALKDFKGDPKTGVLPLADRLIYKGETAGTRVFGENRYTTAIAVSKKYFKKADSVILANGMTSVDAITSSALADAQGAPILLTAKDKLSEGVIDEIKRLEAKEIIIAGGTNAVSSAVQNALADTKAKIIRVDGVNRYATSTLLGKEIIQSKGNKGKVLLANGFTYADALSASTLAAKEGMPVLLTSQGKVETEVLNSLKEWKIKEVVILGGEAAINKEVEKQLKDLNISISRIYGKDRFETSVEIGKAAYPKLENIFLANGITQADALTAGAVTGKEKAALLLRRKDSSIKQVEDAVKDAKQVVIFGGRNAIK